MALTRANAETILVNRLSGLLAGAGMAVTYTGANADLAEPLTWAARRIGLSPASPTTVADSDLSGLGEADYDDYLDLAEYRTLKSIQGHLALVDVTAGPRAEKLSQLASQVQAMLDARKEHIEGLADAPSYVYVSLDMVDYDFT
jgi:hypothetical protein